ncbi:MAG: hypothetical protein LBI10_05450 [Deltaproteobacteria bacterium]|jgi:hypothetical protein|nr:hypothetical protein [Deltaproteobacteria bacterium]
MFALLVSERSLAAALDEETESKRNSFWREKVEFSGLIEATFSARLKKPHNAIVSRLKARLESTVRWDRFYGLISAQAEKNWAIPSETGVNLYEFWVEYVGQGFDLRVGRQIIIWGKADGVQITDLICPPDYAEFIARPLDEIRKPVTAARIRYLGAKINLELIFIPFFQKGSPPGADSPWNLGRVAGRGAVNGPLAEKPKRSLANSEVAFKVAGYFSGLDLAASVFSGFDDFPVTGPIIARPNGQIHQISRYYRRTVLGLEASKPTGDFVFRFEAAFSVGRRRPNQDPRKEPVKQDSLKWLGGLDWTPGDDWTISGQLSGERVLGANKSTDLKESYLTTLNIAKKLFNQRLTLTNMLYQDLTNSSFYDSLKAEYELRDGLIVSLGVDLFGGQKGEFALYEVNSQAWLKLKYYF